MTDSGRTVYGGGGISPDEKYSRAKYNKFQTELLRKYAFFDFAARYFGEHGAKLPANCTPDHDMIEEFHSALLQAQDRLHRSRVHGEPRLDPRPAEGGNVHDCFRSGGVRTSHGGSRSDHREGHRCDAQGEGAARECKEGAGAAAGQADRHGTVGFRR